MSDGAGRWLKDAFLINSMMGGLGEVNPPEKSLELKHTPAWPEISPTARVISWPWCFFPLTYLSSQREVHLLNFQHHGAVATRLVAGLCRAGGVSLINITGSTVWAVYLAVFMWDCWKMWFTAAVWCAGQNLTRPLIFSATDSCNFFFPSLAAAKQLSLVMNEWEKLCLCHCSRSGLNVVLFRHSPNMRRPITFAAISEGNISRTERGSAARSRRWQLGFNPLYFRVSVSLKYYIFLKYSISLVHFSWKEDFIGSPGGLAEQVLRLQKEVQGWRSSQGGL